MAQECSSPQLKTLEPLGQFPASYPLQGTEVTPSLAIPEAAHEWLVPIEDFLTAWKPLPNVSQWVLQTVEATESGLVSSLPRFNGIPTIVVPKQALVIER